MFNACAPVAAQCGRKKAPKVKQEPQATTFLQQRLQKHPQRMKEPYWQPHQLSAMTRHAIRR